MPDLRVQLVQNNGLFHKAHGVQLDRPFVIRQLGIGAHENDLRFQAAFLQRGSHIQPVHVRHAHVADDDVGPQLYGHGQAFPPSVRLMNGSDAKFVPGNVLRDSFADIGFVIHNQDG